VLGNFFLGMIPVIVDIATGNWQRFDDEDISIALVPGQAPPPYGIEPQLPGRQAPPTYGNPPPGGPPTGPAPTFGNPPPSGPPQEPRPPGPN
jgi:hypothetical protein